MLQGEKAWQRCKEGKNWSLLLGVLITSYFWYIVGSVFLHLVSTAAGFAFPLLLDAITKYLELCGAAAVKIWPAPHVTRTACIDVPAAGLLEGGVSGYHLLAVNQQTKMGVTCMLHLPNAYFCSVAHMGKHLATLHHDAIQDMQTGCHVT